MQFFKHFTDAHRGKSLLYIKRKLGMAGVGMYFFLVEMCAEKLTKREEETYTEAHCNFKLDRQEVVHVLGTKWSRIEYVLSTYQEAGLLRAECNEHLISIFMPKILEYLDRDARRARAARGQAAPKRKREEKEEYIPQKEIEPLAEGPIDLSWEESAGLLISALDAGKSGDELEYLGTIYTLAKKAGIQTIKNIPPNEYRLHNISKLLRIADNTIAMENQIDGNPNQT